MKNPINVIIGLAVVLFAAFVFIITTTQGVL